MKRHLEGVPQKSLTQCLRRLECDGLLTRRVVTLSPVAVEYSITTLGRTLLETFRLLYAWVLANMPTVDAARRLFDGPATASA